MRRVQSDRRAGRQAVKRARRFAAPHGAGAAGECLGAAATGEVLSVADVLALQRAAGNTAVARALARQSQPGAPARAPAAEPVTFHAFMNAGTSLNGQALGFSAVGGYFVNAVELRFAVAEGQKRYRELRCRQWSGPEGLHVKRGDPGGARWTTLARGPGTGVDDPLPVNVTRQRGVLAYYDSPGPNLGPMVAAREGRPSRVYSVQNFTGWIEGIPAGGAAYERVTPVVAWHSIMHLADENWDDQAKPPRYSAFQLTGTGLGWRPVEAPSN